MTLNRKERDQLDALSLEIFGKKSFWQKLYKKGSIKNKKDRDSFSSDVRYFFTADEIKEHLKKAKAEADEFLAKMKQNNADNSPANFETTLVNFKNNEG